MTAYNTVSLRNVSDNRKRGFRKCGIFEKNSYCWGRMGRPHSSLLLVAVTGAICLLLWYSWSQVYSQSEASVHSSSQSHDRLLAEVDSLRDSPTAVSSHYRVGKFSPSLYRAPLHCSQVIKVKEELATTKRTVRILHDLAEVWEQSAFTGCYCYCC